ncbi:hypothetical protein AXK57_16800 [Tsukamurella pulmonis]|uniref:Uncharacterized protein n=1 Tax=Tsukamurella pulmonis TaxID=47312 RepID=A0A1H1AYL4_9ACTN|nr:hypothetical protein [Tsukamurella pulmonis]KXO92807.1 hypothetical protein AXK56_22060 [Tsukamurella pulmonis]KXP08133.1 hypothetical protein AXK57_16800 [Tsukamurella pulmonis]SDQ44785.1 hypothetical protein SAMN04489765_0449 [Tsukamurella pulmonis]SUP25909.1 Uncharacterised protein [Tsukamurella pulmonis]
MEFDVMYCRDWNPWRYKALDPVTEERARAMFHTDKRDFTVSAVCGEPGFYEREAQPLFIVGTSKIGAQIHICNRAGSDIQTYSYSNKHEDRMFLFGYTRYYYDDPNEYSMSPDASRFEDWAFREDGSYRLAQSGESDSGGEEVSSGAEMERVLWRPRVVFGRWRELTAVGMIEPAVPGYVGMDWPDVTVDEDGRASIDTSADVVHVKEFPGAKGMP